MAVLIRMPEVAANVTSAQIVSWLKSEGDAVAVGDPLAEIETDKAVIEFVAEAAGVLDRILVPAGKAADVSAPIAVLREDGDGPSQVDDLLKASDDDADLPPAQAPAASAPVIEAHDEDGARIFASPLARRLARESGLVLAGIHGSGPHGRIVRRDIEAALVAGPTAPARISASPAAAPADGPGSVRIPHTAMRRTIARRLTESKTQIPHFYLKADCRVDRLLKMRRQINSAGGRFSINDFVVKAVAAALVQEPDMNVGWTDEAVVRYEAADVCVAVSTESGLVTPVFKDVGRKPLSVLSAEIAALAKRAREHGLAPSEYQGGSFTVSNLGMYGVQEFAAIINPPQAAILAVGAVRKQPVVEESGKVAAASVLSVVLSVDHRCVDGAVAARWLAAFQRLLENPISILV